MCVCKNSLVIVENPDSSLRLCLDPKDLYKAVLRKNYQIPKAEEILNRLSGKQVVFDMKDGLWQLELDEQSSYLATVNSLFERLFFHKLPCCIYSAPDIFQNC